MLFYVSKLKWSVLISAWYSFHSGLLFLTFLVWVGPMKYIHPSQMKLFNVLIGCLALSTLYFVWRNNQKIKSATFENVSKLTDDEQISLLSGWSKLRF